MEKKWFARWKFPRNFWKILKLFSVLLLLTCLLPQTVVAQKISVRIEKGTLDKAFQQIMKSSRVQLVYNMNLASKISCEAVSFHEKEVSEILEVLLAKTDLEYKLENGIYLIKEKVKAKSRQLGKVSGNVKDQRGEPLVGVTVVVKGTLRGTVTNVKGDFVLNGLQDSVVVVVVSFIGKETREVKIKLNSNVVIVLKDDVSEIEGVVITGMFTRRMESFTGSATTFTKQELLRAGNQNLLKSLKNLDPSFQIMENLEYGSDPNRFPNVQLRGQTSFSNLQGEYEGNPNQPLFILDGFETTIEKVFDLDMNRVASVTLLKDAAAKAIYGSKAGNGVVVIETIQPKTGELRVNYSGDLGLEAPDLTGYNLMNASEKLGYEVKIGMYGPAGVITAYDAYKKVYDDVVRGVDTYWLAKPLHVGVSNKHSLTLEGGDGRMRYQLGISYNNVAGVMKKSERSTLNVYTTLSYSYKNLLFRNTLEVSRNWSKNSPYGSFAQYVALNPYWVPYDDEGNLIKKFVVHTGEGEGSDYEQEVYNPLYNATLNTKDESRYTEVRNDFSVDWNISEAFRAVGKFSYKRNESGSDKFYPASHTKFINYDKNGMSDRKGQYTKGDGVRETINVRAGLNFNKTFGNHLFFANLTWELSTSNSVNTTVVAEGFGNDYMDDISFATKYEKNGKPRGANSKLREIGFVGALNYAYADRYLFDVSIRQSASSAYGSDSRWGSFWSVGVGWNIHKERFVEDSEWIKTLKLRASVGYTGTQNLDPAQSRARYAYYDYTYSDKIGAQLVALPNNKLQWQRNKDYNFGMDLALKRFLTLRADYYIQRTEDLLSSISLPPSTGFLKYTENLGIIENKGCEVALSVTPWRRDEQAAYVSFSFSGLHNSNKIKKIYDIFKNSNDDQNSSFTENVEGDVADAENIAKYTKPATLYYEGCSMTAIWGVRSLGIDPASGREMFLTKDGKSTYSWSANDQVVVGDNSPKLQGNIGMSAGYKGFSASISCSYKLGGDLYNSELIARMENITGYENLDRRIFDAWQQIGDEAPYRVTLLSGGYANYTRPTSRFVQRNNELYVSSVSVSYDFASSKWLKKAALERLKVSFYMNELVRLSSIEIERGTQYPFARNFSFSVQASF